MLGRPSCDRFAASFNTGRELTVTYANGSDGASCLFDMENAALSQVQLPEQLPFERIELEAIIRFLGSAGGALQLELAPRYHGKRPYLTPMAAVPDRTPRFTERITNRVELQTRSIDLVGSTRRSCDSRRPIARRVPRILPVFAPSGDGPAQGFRVMVPRLWRLRDPGSCADPSHCGGDTLVPGDLEDRLATTELAPPVSQRNRCGINTKGSFR